MAAIDKTYIKTYEQYLRVVAWCNTQEVFDYGKIKINISDYIYPYVESDFDGVTERVLWNTPTYIDVYLAKNCNIDFIQDRLHEQYDYERLLKIEVSNINPKTNHHYKIEGHIPNKICGCIEIIDHEYYYEDEFKEWLTYNDPHYTSSSCCMLDCDKRKLVRMINHWDLKKDTEFIIYDIKKNKEWKIKVKLNH